MKEAFDAMAEHWGVTLWIGIVIIVSFSRWRLGGTTTKVINHYGKDEGSKSES